jgi:hypothetical protein
LFIHKTRFETFPLQVLLRDLRVFAITALIKGDRWRLTEAAGLINCGATSLKKKYGGRGFLENEK